ncbi:MAG: acyl-CoA dehydrogenase family protein [Acidimicrobiia bacterium]|nr:acyl-CoA dehydrogenase family protein [Acidimicrobiia bacterium]
MSTTTEPSGALDSDEAALVGALVDRLVTEHDPADTVAFLGAQYDLGLAWVQFPLGFGGVGASPKLQKLVQERIAEVKGPQALPRNGLGIGMGGPVVTTYGSEEHRRRWLRPMFTAEEIWCQLFSEPGAGSDLAGLATRAERDGDEWVVNGQKVWTSGAHLARWGMLVARTDPAQPKHKGLTYFIVDMHSPGVEVRPLRQMTGQAEFNEVYFTDARVPDANRMGDVGDGWRVSLTTLMNERVMIGGGIPQRGDGVIRRAVRAWETSPGRDAASREDLMRLWVLAEVTRLTNWRASQNRAKGNPGPEGSVGKLLAATLNQQVSSFTMNLSGPAAMLYPVGYEMDRRHRVPMEKLSDEAFFLRARANSIEGGTSEIMRNILGERVLGLAGDVRVDKDLPWTEVPR